MPADAVTDQPSRWGGARILLAEDDDATRRVLCCALRGEGHRVICARDGDELLDLVAVDLLSPRDPSAFDLIVSDIVMPGISGLEILCGLHAAGSATPFIVITAFGTPELEERARLDGARYFFDKPFDLEDFRAAVAKSLEPLWIGDAEREVPRGEHAAAR